MSNSNPWKCPQLQRVSDDSSQNFHRANKYSAPASYYRAEGMIKNVNTVEEYRNIDKAKMLTQAGQMVRQ